MALLHKSATKAATKAGARPAVAPLRAARHAVVVRAEAEAAAAPAAPAAKPAWTQPTLDPNTPSPVFGGSTGGLLKKAQVEEFYVITWTAQKEAIFEMPTGGAAIMRQGPNLLKLAKKEQCLALTTQLRSKFKLSPCFYRVFPDGKVQYLHPADGELFFCVFVVGFFFPTLVAPRAQRAPAGRCFFGPDLRPSASSSFLTTLPLNKTHYTKTHYNQNNRRVPGEGQRGPGGRQPEHAPHRRQRQPDQGQVHGQGPRGGVRIGWIPLMMV
jgi:photosystem I subunit 2